MSRKLIQIILSLIVIIVITIILYFLSSSDARIDQSYFTLETNFATSSGSTTYTPIATSNTQLYTNSQYGFSAFIPAGIQPKAFEGGEGDTVLIQSADSKFSMQIYITPFEEDVSLTAQRIHKDISDLKMEEPIEISTDGVATVAFFSTDGTAKYREIWFVSRGNLYQIIAPASQDDATGKVMESWKWK